MIELDNFIIESNSDIKYKEDIIKTLETNTRLILNFFELDKLSEKKKIVIYNSLDEYKTHMENYAFAYEIFKNAQLKQDII